MKVAFDAPGAHPSGSVHWLRLSHRPGDAVLHTQSELVACLAEGVGLGAEPEPELGLWSCIFGYCEALATHRDPARRFALFPVRPTQHVLQYCCGRCPQPGGAAGSAAGNRCR